MFVIELDRPASPKYTKCTIRAIQLGQTESIKVLLKNSDECLNKAQQQNSLYTAARLGHTEICQLIVNAKSVDSSHISSALILACTNDHLATAQFLIRHCKRDDLQLTGAMISVCTQARAKVGPWLAKNVLHLNVSNEVYWIHVTMCALGSADVTDLKRFLDQSRSYCFNPKEFSSRALRVACWNGRAKVVNYLLDNTPADIASKGRVKTNGDQITALMAACRGKCSKSLIRQLLQRVTPYVINISSDPSKSTVLHVVIWSSNDSVRDFPLHKACLEGDVSTVRKLMYAHDVNAQDINGFTPLHYACATGCAETVMLLLSVDARTDITNNQGCMPAVLADASGNSELADFICSLHMMTRQKSSAKVNSSRDKILLNYHEAIDCYYPAISEVDDSLLNSQLMKDIRDLRARTETDVPATPVTTRNADCCCTCARCGSRKRIVSYESCPCYLTAITFVPAPDSIVKNFNCPICRSMHVCEICGCGCGRPIIASQEDLRQAMSLSPHQGTTATLDSHTGHVPASAPPPPAGPVPKLTKEQEAMIKKEIARRTKDLEKQLAADGFQAVDVAGDGNCFFRAACLLLDNNELGHLKLRERVASYVERLGHFLDGVVDT